MKIEECIVFYIEDYNESNRDIFVFSCNSDGYKEAIVFLLNYAENCYSRENLKWYNPQNWNYLSKPISFEEFKKRKYCTFGNGDDLFFNLSINEMYVTPDIKMDIE